MFELVDSQPSHMVSVDVLNLTPGNYLPLPPGYTPVSLQTLQV